MLESLGPIKNLSTYLNLLYLDIFLLSWYNTYNQHFENTGQEKNNDIGAHKPEKREGKMTRINASLAYSLNYRNLQNFVKNSSFLQKKASVFRLLRIFI